MSAQWSANSETPRPFDPSPRHDATPRCPRCSEAGEALGDVHSTLEWFLCRCFWRVWAQSDQRRAPGDQRPDDARPVLRGLSRGVSAMSRSITAGLRLLLTVIGHGQARAILPTPGELPDRASIEPRLIDQFDRRGPTRRPRKSEGQTHRTASARRHTDRPGSFPTHSRLLSRQPRERRFCSVRLMAWRRCQATDESTGWA